MNIYKDINARMQMEYFGKTYMNKSDSYTLIIKFSFKHIDNANSVLVIGWF